MKKAALLVSLVFGFMALGQSAFAQKEVQIGINGVFVPAGFDSSTESYVVVNGIFPNGCYSWKKADVNNVDNFNHEVKSYASVNQGMCIMVLIPFQKDVSLGKLNTGKHSIKFLSGDGTYIEKTLVIE